MAKTSARGGTLTAKADGRKLKSLRGDLMQREVEDDLDIPRGQLTRFETGKPVGIKYLLKLAAYYKVHPKDLLDLEGVQSASGLLRDLAQLLGSKVEMNFENNGGDQNTVEQEASLVTS